MGQRDGRHSYNTRRALHRRASTGADRDRHYAAALQHAPRSSPTNRIPRCATIGGGTARSPQSLARDGPDQ